MKLYRLCLLLVFLVALGCQPQEPAQGMTTFWWPDHTPAGQPKALLIKALLPESDTSYPHADGVVAWAEANGWTPGVPQCVIISLGNWKSQQAHNLLKGGDGQVTVESIGYHVRKRMANWSRINNWWTEYCLNLHEAGYEVALVAMDIEGCKMTTGWKYDPDPPGSNLITMKDVLAHIYSKERWRRSLPRLHPEWVAQAPGWGNRQIEQQMIIWNHWATTQNARAMTNTFAAIAKLYWPDVIVNNYDLGGHQGAPMITWPHGHPRATCSVDGNPAPVLYLQQGYGYRTNSEALSALDSCLPSDGRKTTCVPWIGGAHREGATGWYIQASDPDKNAENLADAIEAAGCPFLMKF